MTPHGKSVHRVLKIGAKGPDVKELQQGLRHVFDHFKIDWPVHVDGVYGHHSRKAALVAQYVSGISKKSRHLTRTAGLPQIAQQQIRGSEPIRFGAIRRRHREKQIKHLRKASHRPEAGGPAGAALGNWDGRQVAGWMVGTRAGPDGKTVNWLQRIEDTGHWAGGLYSGYRTPAESVAACYAICGAASCSGLCAGTASNHDDTGPPHWGAIDVVNPSGFEAGVREVGAPFANLLPADPNHHSPSGY